MRIGINLLYLLPNEVGGTETYVRNLLAWLEKTDRQNEYVIFTNRENHSSFVFSSPRFRTILCDFSARVKLFRILWEQVFLPTVVRRTGVDLLYSPGYVIPILVRCPNVVGVHDSLYKRLPGLISLAKRIYWSLFVPLSIRRSRAVITGSQFSGSELKRFFPSATDKIVSIPHGIDDGVRDSAVDDEAIVKRFGVRGEYILTVATLSPHKNLPRLLEAFRILLSRHPEVRLVIAGKFERAADDLLSKMQHLRIKESVQLLGFVSRRELDALYRGARVFVLPSVMEGFGFPILEAMKAGCPVACSRVASLPEVGGDAAVYFDPFDVRDIGDALHRLLVDEGLRTRCIELGKTNIRRFSWERSAQETIRVFCQVGPYDVREQPLRLCRFGCQARGTEPLELLSGRRNNARGR